jgi:hypothetical protein
MKAIEVILNKLDEILAPMDANYYEESYKSALERRAKYYDYINSDEYKDRSVNYAERHAKSLAIAGGKVWKEMFEWGVEEMAVRIKKRCDASAKARNAKIAKKLEASGIVSVEGVEFANSSNGFEGRFHIVCNGGIVKKVSIDIIIAGGYNIQCAHYRVLCNVK